LRSPDDSPAARRYQTPIGLPGFVPTAAVRLYLRAAPATALLQPDNVPLLIAGGSVLSGFFLAGVASHTSHAFP